MYCGNCGSKNDDGSLFCEACGGPIRNQTMVHTITQSTKLPVATIICAGVMILLSFFWFYILNGQMDRGFSFPIYFNAGFYYAINSMLSFSVPILLLVFSILSAKKNPKLLIIPIAICFLQLGISSVADYVIYRSFYPFSYYLPLLETAAVLSVFALTVSGNIKSRYPVMIVSFVAAAIPLIEFITYYIHSSTYLRYIALYLGYGFLALWLDKNSVGENAAHVVGGASLQPRINEYCSQTQYAAYPSAAQNFTQPYQVNSQPYSNETDTISKLKQLKELLDQGVLTADEFEAKKTDLLAKL